jgi:DNA-binding transcriptional regulator YiaG
METADTTEPLSLADAQALSLARQALATGEARRARLEARLTIGDVARVVGCTTWAVLRWEAGQRVPAAEFGVPYGRLLRRLGVRP